MVALPELARPCPAGRSRPLVPHRADGAAGGRRAHSGLARADADGRVHRASDRRSARDRLRRARRRRVRPLHDRRRLRDAVDAVLPDGDPADLSVRGRAALAAGDRLCAVHRGAARQSALLRAAGADAGARGMAGHHAGAALRHDRDPAGGLHCARESKGLKPVAHPVRACAEAVVADAGDGHRHQYRPPARRHADRGDRSSRCRASAGCWSARSTPATSSSSRAWCCWSPSASSSSTSSSTCSTPCSIRGSAMATLELSIQDEAVAAPVRRRRKLGLLFWLASAWLARCPCARDPRAGAAAAEPDRHGHAGAPAALSEPSTGSAPTGSAATSSPA